LKGWSVEVDKKLYIVNLEASGSETGVLVFPTCIYIYLNQQTKQKKPP